MKRVVDIPAERVQDVLAQCERFDLLAGAMSKARSLYLSKLIEARLNALREAITT